MPCQQGLRSYDGGHFCQQPSSQRPGSDGQTAALIVGEAKPPRAELTAKDSVFLPQILNGVLLPLIHPSGNGQEQKAERVQCLRHRLSSLTSHTSSVLLTDCFGHAFSQFQFLDNTASPFRGAIPELPSTMRFSAMSWDIVRMPALAGCPAAALTPLTPPAAFTIPALSPAWSGSELLSMRKRSGFLVRCRIAATIRSALPRTAGVDDQ